MAKRLSRPGNPVRVRLEWEEAKMPSLDMAAAGCGLSVASFARLALELLVADQSVTLAGVKAAATKLTSGEPAPTKPTKKGKPAPK